MLMDFYLGQNFANFLGFVQMSSEPVIDKLLNKP